MLRSQLVAALVGYCFVPTLASAETRVSSHERARAAPPVTGQGLALGTLTNGTRLDKVAISLRSGPADTRVAATLQLSTSLAEQDAGLELAVPAGAQVTYLAITMGGERRIAHTEQVEEARQAYDDIVHGIERRDPALLELTDSTETTDTLSLRVFPLVKGKPAKIELIMTVPQATKFVVDPGKRAIPRVDVEVDGRRSSFGTLAGRRAVALPEPVPGALPAEAADRVTSGRALFIDLPPARDLDEDASAEEVFSPERLAAEARRERRREFKISEDCLRSALCGAE
jgi:hypothetical protein